jgi:hypothetical protein
VETVEKQGINKVTGKIEEIFFFEKEKACQ